MAFDFLNSLTQKYIAFVTTVQVTVVPGLNYGKVAIFICSTDAATYFTAGNVPAADTLTEVSYSNYAQITQGLLKTWLQGFYQSGSQAYVELIVVTGVAGLITPLNLAADYVTFDERAYFKTAIGSTAVNNIDNNVQLARLCIADPLSQYFYGSNDTNILTNTADNEADQFIGAQITGVTGTTTSGSPNITAIAGDSGECNPGWVGAGIAGAGIPAGATIITFTSSTALVMSTNASANGSAVPLTLTFDIDVPIVYHPSTTQNGALVQLGATLAQLNNTGTYVGNKLDWVAISGWTASGTAGANLTAVQAANCVTLGVAFFSTLGNGTGNVALEGGASGLGWSTPLGANLGANWIKNYIDTVAAINTTTYLTSSAQLGFKNNLTYQVILTILQAQLTLFAGILRLGAPTVLPNGQVPPSSAQGPIITAPPFSQLPPASGRAIIVPNAWAAQYLDNVRSVNIYGTLTIAA
jgi:hypothetical protein